jgi:hypothetical protein
MLEKLWILNWTQLSCIIGWTMVHNYGYFIEITNMHGKCQVSYCGKKVINYGIIVHYISLGQTYVILYLTSIYVSMAFTNIALSLFHHTPELEKTHHLVVTECGCVNKLVDGVVNLVQIPNTNVCRITIDPSSSLPLMTFCKVRASALWAICNWHKISPILLGDYDYCATKSRVWNGSHSHHIISIHLLCVLPFIFVLRQ